MTDLFTAQTPPAITPAPIARPPGWRPPDLPREHVCRVCQGAAVCGVGEAWFCVPHAPADFWPTRRSA